MSSIDLFESVPNFSEGRDRDVIDGIVRGARGADVLDVDPDPDHHRVVVSIAGSRERLTHAVVGAVSEAVARIDLRAHAGLHPRVGVADVVPVIPLGGASLDACRSIARYVGQQIWSELRVPVFFYGYGEDRTLADIRAGRARPSLGGPDLHPTAGAVCVGARRLLVAFNVMLPGVPVREARAIARSLRESAGGVRGVQALVFELPGRAPQLSMNLFRIDETTPAALIDELERRGVNAGDQQVVGLCPAVAANEAAAGRILEARLAAAAAREGSRRCRERGGEELEMLAKRLDREADELAQLGAGQEHVLAGAERSGALAPVLGAAGVLDPELDAMLAIAARGLRDAVSDSTRTRYRERVAALERRLA